MSVNCQAKSFTSAFEKQIAPHSAQRRILPIPPYDNYELQENDFLRKRR